jgi:hypothetical protein
MSPSDDYEDAHLRKLTVCMRRKYGAVEIEFCISKISDPDTVLQQREEFNALVLQLNNQHEVYAAEQLPKTKDLSRATGLVGSDGLAKYEAVKLLRETKSGKFYFKMVSKSGKYKQYGCTIWKEELERYGIAELLGDRLEMDLAGVTMWCEDRSRGGAVRRIEGLP